MKKVLIASTALVAAGLMTTGTASASEKIKLNLGGYSKWWVVGAWQQQSFERAIDNGTSGQGSPTSVDVKGENEVWFGGSTTLDNGIKVGIDMQLRAGGTVDTSVSGGDVIDESYIWIEGGFGKFIVGSENNGTYLLHVMAPDAAGNTGEGGILSGNQAIALPASVSTLRGGNTTAILTDNDADKITYVAPTFYGLTLGATYVPNATEDNQFVLGSNATAVNATTNNSASEIYGVGALYANTFGGVGVKLSAGWVTYDIAAQTARSQELAFGGQLSYAGFTVGGSYRDIKQNQHGDVNNATLANGGSNGGTSGTDLSGYGWDAGIQYASGPYAVSFVYFNSKVEGSFGSSAAASGGQDEVTYYQLSGKYNLGAGVDVLASIGHIEYDDETAKTANADSAHNKGWAVMTGLSLAF